MRPRFTLIPGGGTPDGNPGPVPPPEATILPLGEAEATLRRLSASLRLLQTPDLPIPDAVDRFVVAVFDREALPELAGLMYAGDADA